MNDPRKYRADPELLETVLRHLMKGIFNAATTALSPYEISLLTAASLRLEEVFPWGPSESIIPYIQVLNDLLHQAEQVYGRSDIGAWSLAGFRVSAGLGSAVAQPNQTHFAARLHFKSQIKVAVMMSLTGTLDSNVALYMKFLIKNGAGSSIPEVLSFEEGECERRTAVAHSTGTMDEWLGRVSDLLPALAAPLLSYSCLVELVSQRHISEEQLSRDVVPLQTAMENLKRFEELLAHLFFSWPLFVCQG